MSCVSHFLCPVRPTDRRIAGKGFVCWRFLINETSAKLAAAKGGRGATVSSAAAGGDKEPEREESPPKRQALTEMEV